MDRLREDLEESTEYQIAHDGTLLLHTFGSIDAVTLLPANRPANVTYRLEQADGLRYLLREQTFVDEIVPPPTQKDLVALQVRALHVDVLPERDDEDLNSTSQLVPVPIALDVFHAIPSRLRLRIEFDDPASTIERLLFPRKGSDVFVPKQFSQTTPRIYPAGYARALNARGRCHRGHQPRGLGPISSRRGRPGPVAAPMVRTELPVCLPAAARRSCSTEPKARVSNRSLFCVAKLLLGTRLWT